MKKFNNLLTFTGHEWMRAKWSTPVRKYWKLSEQMMVKYCDLAICDFIRVIFGVDYILNNSTALLMSVNLMLTIMVQLPSQLFMIYKLYRYDRPIIIISAALNIIVSCALVRSMGIDGVLIGTFLTSLLYLFSRFYIISKEVYKIPYKHYIKKLARCFAVSVASVGVVYFAIRGIPGTTIKTFLVRMMGVGLLAILVPASCLCMTKEFDFLINKFTPRKLKKFYSKWIIWIPTVCLTVVFSFLKGI